MVNRPQVRPSQLKCEEYLLGYFWDNPTHKYPFGEELDTPSIVDKMSSNSCQLKEGEGESLTSFFPRRRNLTSSWNPSKMSPNQGEKQQISWSTTLTREIVLLSLYPPVKNCIDCIKYKPLQIRSIPGYYRHLCQPNVLKPWPLISSGPYLRVKMAKDGSSSLRIVPPSGSNCLHYPMRQLKNVPLP
ncbi:hypothetical protein TNCV_1817081 [Trichonephila clavipes]|nr:hypothetical protein TNCV_1817081 [Trichonephila clavipes]